MRTTIAVVAMAAVVMAFSAAARAEPVQQAKLTASDAAASDCFGYSVGISGSYAVAGAHGNDDNGDWSGSAYVFYRDQGGDDNWGQQKKLTASDAATNDRFGGSVGISGSCAVVGATGDDNHRGSAYMFYRDQGGVNNWGQRKKLTTSDGVASDYFGGSVAISGSYVIAGATGDDSSRGSAYVFYKDQGGNDNWGQQKKLIAFDRATNDCFGGSVAISGAYAIAGAPFDDDDGDWSGSAYVFYRDQGGSDNWGRQKKLTASDAAAQDFFGYSVSISGDYAVAGALGDDSRIGSAYVFYRDQGGTNNWGQVAKLTASDGAASDEFGRSVAIDGNVILIGADYGDGNENDSGSAYVFLKPDTGWADATEKYKLTASDGADEDRFGWSVAVSGTYGLVGAYCDDDNGSGSGSAYVFSDVPEPATLSLLVMGGLALLRRRKV